MGQIVSQNKQQEGKEVTETVCQVYVITIEQYKIFSQILKDKLILLNKFACAFSPETQVFVFSTTDLNASLYLEYLNKNS